MSFSPADSVVRLGRFAGAVIVVKLGGAALAAKDPADASILAAFTEDLALMRAAGILPVVVHGGGPQVNALMTRLGMTPEFRDGQRVTDAETLDILRMVLVGKVNRDIVDALNVRAPIAVGISGEDARFITVTKRDVALGFVGDVASVEPRLLNHLLEGGFVPVVATVCVDRSGHPYNVNADAAASAIAAALGADKLIYLTDVEGVRAVGDDPSTVLAKLTPNELDGLIDDGSIKGGMIPKASACSLAVRRGVKAAQIVDGRLAHAVLQALFGEPEIGTTVSS